MNFGLKYYAELRSRHKELFWRVEIHERGYLGSAEQMLFCADHPIVITWEKRGDEFFVPVKASEASLGVMSFSNFQYLCLFTSDPRKYRVSIFRNTKLYWRGYVVADLYSESFTAPPYSVTIKAVDGFNLLSSIPFVHPNGSQLAGHKSLWELLCMCMEVLELSVHVADWMDIFAEGMDETQSPLRQLYVSMERFYNVYNSPSYRDVLELCLKPFAAQIFQSNGALHIRRLASLYHASRPISFYSVGSEFPAGWLVTADGRDVITSSGDHILTNTTRERIESLWEEAINLSGESVLEIVPAVRNISLSVKNKSLENILPQIGLFATSPNDRLLINWNDTYGHLSLTGENSLYLYGNKAGKEREDVMEFKGFPVEQCNYKLLWEFTLNGGSSRERSTSTGMQGVEIELAYGMKIVGANSTYYLLDNGSWSTSFGWLTDKINTATDANKKFEIEGFPLSGTLVVYIKQTLYAYYSGRSGYADYCTFMGMSLTMDTGDISENALKQVLMVDRGNNVDLSIALPTCDIPNIPNDRLIFSLYFVDKNNLPTRIWHSRGKNDYNTLLNHLIDCTLRFKQRPSSKIAGEMFTGKHIDMNSVVQDDKYLMAGFYLNSIELKALEDGYTCELVEMPNLLRHTTLPEEDDCVRVASLPTIKKVLPLDHLIILQTTSGTILCYDSYSGYLTEIAQASAEAMLFPADHSFVIVDRLTATVVDYRGINLKSEPLFYASLRPPYNPFYYLPIATFMSGYLYCFEESSQGNSCFLFRLGYPYQQRADRSRTGETDNSVIVGMPYELHKSFSAIGINTHERAYLHDLRSHVNNNCDELEPGSEIKTLSDFFIGYNTADSFKIYRRDRIDLPERTLIKTVTGRVQCAAHTLSEVAYAQNNQVTVWSYRENTTRSVMNLEGRNKPIRGLFYLRGELHIVREDAIYKFIPE